MKFYHLGKRGGFCMPSNIILSAQKIKAIGAKDNLLLLDETTSKKQKQANHYICTTNSIIEEFGMFMKNLVWLIYLASFILASLNIINYFIWFRQISLYYDFLNDMT